MPKDILVKEEFTDPTDTNINNNINDNKFVVDTSNYVNNQNTTIPNQVNTPNINVNIPPTQNQVNNIPNPYGGAPSIPKPVNLTNINNNV